MLFIYFACCLYQKPWKEKITLLNINNEPITEVEAQEKKILLLMRLNSVRNSLKSKYSNRLTQSQYGVEENQREKCFFEIISTLKIKLRILEKNRF